MAKRVVASLGIHHNNKKKKLKKQPINRKKRFLRKALHYLCSDYHMYAPFTASVDDDDDITTTSASPTEAEKSSEGKKKNLKLIDKVGDYLKSDCYMYAPLSHYSTETSPPPPPPQGPTWLDKRPTTSASDGELTKEIDQPTEPETVHVTKRDQFSDNRPYRRSTRFQQTREHHETVNYIVQQNCRPSPGEGILGPERRNLVVE